ncbi:aspartate kinase [Alicyclobacillus cycloheptanicus]|uniref:Aspartokinase n=1 Tax=Alicyclobacillus cycloheptanicus TaxID=1457 RepID=A0ABT9XHI3_9BACL|nr:aspartate kinase [Alicyclobacillus cycloheptanicus]MDQ0189748.1 aspartate kinase [Alicyclobacillus cycloheptanicus]WDM01956.1 aspartate kinase [Alicyclobacillus cycloheptanicus]
MSVRILKFGGTSVASPQARAAAVQHVKRTLEQGVPAVVVVSAMGRSGDPYATDTLLSLVGPDAAVSARELDVLMACGETISAVVFANLLCEHGVQATALNGQQAGIMTDDRHGDASILGVNPARIESELAKGCVPVVTGFQGYSPSGEITTLGRGGSDTTAAALGVALEAEAVDIYTDVAGVMTADPRIVPDAQKLPNLSYQEMYQFALQGAKVVHPRAVELAMQKGVPMYVRCTTSTDSGTLIGHADGPLEGGRTLARPVIGVTQQSDVARLMVESVGHRCGEILDGLARCGLDVDWIASDPGQFSCVIGEKHAQVVQERLQPSGLRVEVTCGFAKVVVVGGVASDTVVLAQVAQVLADEGIEMVQTGHLSHGLGVLVQQSQMKQAVGALHAAFDLGSTGWGPRAAAHTEEAAMPLSAVPAG